MLRATNANQEFNIVKSLGFTSGTETAPRALVTHRIDMRQEEGSVLFEFHGLVDADALRSLRATIELVRRGGATVRLVLREGAEVERSCLADLRTLEATVVAESPYLARWIARD
jgi:hypothetical protein